jgi:ABC-type uncharacterized transport system substrate-binding protein
MSCRVERRVFRRSLLLAGIGCVSACSILSPAPDHATRSASSDSRETSAPASTSRDPGPSDRLPRPGAGSTPSTATLHVPPRAIVLLSSDLAQFGAVAAALNERLSGAFQLERLVLTDPDSRKRLATLDANAPLAVVAIGFDAADFASRDLRVPVIFCDVFSYERLLSTRSGIYGVAPLPPLHMQLARWKHLAPGVRTVGTIIGPEHPRLIEEVRRAAAEVGVELEVELASSDREAIYRFKRLVPRIGAFWLFPDNDILSPNVIREMLGYARDHGVHSIVFNSSLLDWGALVSMSSRPSDVAAAVAHILETLAAGRTRTLPALTPLTEIDVEVNDTVAAELGLTERATAARAP